MSLSVRSYPLLLACVLLLACGTRPLPEPVRPLVTTPDAPFRQSPPPLPAGTGELGALPAIEAATLPNGLSLWVAHRPQLPYVALTLAVRGAGTLAGTTAAERIRLTTLAVVDAGTVWPDGRVVEPPQLDGQGVTAWSGLDSARFSMRVVTPSLAEGTRLLGLSLQSPAFGRGTLDDVRLAELARLQSLSNGLDHALLQLALQAHLEPGIARQLLASDMDEIKRSGPSEVERCFGELFRPENSALIAVGDVKLSALLPLAEAALAGWQARLPARSPRAHATPRALASQSRVHFLPQSDRGQARVLLVQPAPPSSAREDELAYLLMAHIAVGALRSRANLSLRHEAGITYGVAPKLLRAPELGLLLIGGSFESEETARALQDLQRTLKQLQTGLVTEGELRLAKIALLADLERRAHDNHGLAQLLAGAFAQHEPPSWLAALPSAVANATPADIQRVARRYLRPQQLEISVAGPPALAEELEPLGELAIYETRRSDDVPEHE